MVCNSEAKSDIKGALRQVPVALTSFIETNITGKVKTLCGGDFEAELC